jgi:hypothetical protein
MRGDSDGNFRIEEVRAGAMVTEPDHLPDGSLTIASGL